MTQANEQPAKHTGVLRIGCAAGFSGDRTDAALPVVQDLIAAGKPSVLMFETLAERTLALAQLARRENPNAGYEPLLDELLRPVLARCLEHGIRIISNFGAANPRGAAKRILDLAAELGARRPKIAVVEGDDLLGAEFRPLLIEALGDRLPRQPIVSANAYIGAEPIADALRAGADIVVCGRVADPSLVLGPALAYFGWSMQDWDRLGRATMVGHLLECGSQVSGGYFADPGFKEVPDLAHVGYPIAEIDAEGNCTVSKPQGTGGRIDSCTVKEQLLYELHDPAAYMTPDVTADITAAQVIETGVNQVRVEGVKGHARPPTLKVNVCFEAGWFAEAEISYAGARAGARALLAAEVIRERLGKNAPIRLDLIGAHSIFGDDANEWLDTATQEQLQTMREARDVRLRLSWQRDDRAEAMRLTREVNALYCAGPAGGGGVRQAVRARLGTVSCFVPREAVKQRFAFIE